MSGSHASSPIGYTGERITNIPPFSDADPAGRRHSGYHAHRRGAHAGPLQPGQRVRTAGDPETQPGNLTVILEAYFYCAMLLGYSHALQSIGGARYPAVQNLPFE